MHLQNCHEPVLRKHNLYRSRSTVTPHVCLTFPDYNSKPAWTLLVLSGSVEDGTATAQGTPLACQPIDEQCLQCGADKCISRLRGAC